MPSSCLCQKLVQPDDGRYLTHCDTVWAKVGGCTLFRRQRLGAGQRTVVALESGYCKSLWVDQGSAIPLCVSERKSCSQCCPTAIPVALSHEALCFCPMLEGVKCSQETEPFGYVTKLLGRHSGQRPVTKLIPPCPTNQIVSKEPPPLLPRRQLQNRLHGGALPRHLHVSGNTFNVRLSVLGLTASYHHFTIINPKPLPCLLRCSLIHGRPR